jgi:hypothetical protein
MLNKDFKEFAELLNSTGVEYLIVGGYALAAHGHPRYTGDLDIWIRPNNGNIDRVLDVLARFDLCQSRRVVMKISGVDLPIIGLDEFRANKRASGRAKDLADLESLGSPEDE